jgi:hypothetical protein
MAAKNVTELYQALRPLILRELATAGGATAANGGMETHDLAGPYHTGTLLESQAPWAASKVEWQAALATHAALPDVHHAQAHVLATNAGLGADHTISGAAAGHVLRASSATAAAFAQLAHSDLSAIGTNTHTQIDTHIANSDIHVAHSGVSMSAGDGLTGGGTIAATRSFAVALSAVSGLELTGTSPNKTLQLADSVAGAGLASNNKVLSVGVANTGATGLTVEADAVRLTSSSNPGAAAAVLASDATGKLTLPLLVASSSVTTPLVTAGAGQSLTLQAPQDIILSPGTNLAKLAAGKHLQSETFTSGFAGAGWRIEQGALTAAEVDNLTVRGTMRVYELLIQQIRATNGSVFVSSSAKLEAVTLVSGSTYDCTTDGSAADYQPFAVGDVLRAQRVNLGSGTLVWRSDLVVTAINVGGNARKFRATLQSATTAPAAGMEFVRLGNTSDVARQGAVYLTADDSGAPFIDVVAGIAAHADWNTAGKVKTRLGRLDGIFGQTDEFGLWAGTGVTAGDRYIRASNSALELRNIPLALFDGSANTLLLSPGEGNRSPFLALGSPLPTAPITNDGVWLGLDEATTNYVQNPSFEVSTGTYWSYYSTPTVAQGGDALYGAYSLSMTTGAVADPYLYRQNSGAALASGQAWTFSAWVKAGNAGAVGKTVTIRLREQPGNLTSAVTIVLSAAWQRVTVTRTLTNATPTELNHYLQITSAASSGDVLLVDGVQLEQLAYATPYCDGSLGDGHTWSGTAHASASSRAGGYKLRVGTVANGVLQRGLLWDGANLVWKAANTSLDASGNLTASNATLSGQVTATTGAIGGWSIASTTLTGGNVLLDAAGKMRVGAASADRLWIDATHADYRLWVGDDTPGAAEFSVTKGGALSATGATISGAITATSGTVTGDFSVTSGGKLTAGGGGVLFDASGQAMGLYPNIDGAATPPDTAKAIAWYDTPSTRTGLQARQYVGKASDSTPHWNVTVNPGGSSPLTMTLWWGGSTLNELRFTNLALVFGLPALSLAGGLTPTAQVLSGSRLQLNSGSEFVSAAHLKAATANTYDLGEVGVKWRKLYVQEVVADTVSGGTALGGNTWQRPDAGDMYINSFSEAGNRTLYVANPGAGVMHLNVEGDIALGGLVDGVDLAAFKTAYDGHNHDGRYYTETELQTSGSASVHWGNVTNKPATFAPAAHALVGSDHTASGLTAGHVVRASGPTTFAWAQLAHSDLSGVGTNTHTQIDSHIAATAAHGVSGAIVGTTDTQTLSNKTLTTPTIASFANAPHAHTNAASGGTIAHGSLTGIGANDHHSQAHVLASTSGLGADHTVAGLTARQVLRATGATTAAFGAIEDADLPSTIVRTSRQIIAGNGLTGGGALSADVTVTMGTPGALSATSTDAVTATSHTHSIDSSIARSAITLTAGDGLTGGGNLTANRTLTLGTPGSITATSTNAVTSTSHTHAADSTLARSAITITAGAGLTGGGDLTANRTLDIGAGDGITVGADAISLALSAVSGLELAGTSPNKTLQLADSIAGAGLTTNNKVLSVGVSGLGLSVGADAVTLTSSSNPGAAASILASTAAGGLTLVDMSVTSLATSRLVASDGADKLVSVADLSAWVAGTANRVSVASDGDGTITLSAPQDIHTAASPTFVGATLTGLTASRLVASNGSDALVSVADLSAWVAGTANRVSVASDGDGTITLSSPQDIHTAASPTFIGATLTGLTASRLVASNGSDALVSVADLSAWVAGTANRVSVASDGDGTITLSSPQDIHTAASPTFVGATLTGLTASRLVASNGSDALVSVADLSAWVAGTANRVTVASDGDGTITLSAPQDIHTAASPTFGGLIAPWLRPASDSTTALQLRNASGAAILTVDTTNGRVGINGTPGNYRLDVTGSARISDDLLVADYLDVDGAATVAGTFDVGTVLRVNTAGTRIGINREADSQFDLDVAGAIRGQYLVGKHAIQLASAVGVWHFDGPGPYNLDFSGSAHSHAGVGPNTLSGGAIYRPGRFGKALQLASATTNLITNPSFETNSTGWVTNSATLTRVEGIAQYGAYSALVVQTGASARIAYTITVAASTTYTVSAWLYSPLGNTGLPYLYVQNVNGSAFSQSSNVSAHGGWQRVTITFTTPADVTSIVVRVYPNGTAQSVYVDGVQLEQLAYATPYCDGSLGDGHTWSGTTHASASSRTVASIQYNSIVPAAAWTVAGWFRSTIAENAGAPTGGRPRFLTIGPLGAASSAVLRVNGAATALELVTYSPAGAATTATNVADLNYTPADWIFLAVSYDGDKHRVFAGLAGAGAMTTYIGTSLPGNYGNNGLALLFDGQPGFDLLDELLVLDYAADAKLVRAIYESDAPVFVASSVLHWRSPSRVPVWVDEYGLWAQSVSGAAILGVYGGDPRNPAGNVTRSWGGVTMAENDVVIGRTTAGAALHWDDSAGALLLGVQSGNHIELTSTTLKIKAGVNDRISLDSGGNASFVGAIDANSGTLASLTVDGALTVGASGSIGSGATSFAAGTGFWLEYNGGTPRLRIGTTAGNRLTWDGTTLTIAGSGGGITGISGSNITTGTIDASVVTVTNLNASNVSTGTLSADRIGANSITAAKIAAGTITATEIAASTITGAKIAATTITASNIAAGTITATEIAASTITGAKIAANTITASNIAAGTITATEIAASTITGAKIAANTITASNIAAGTITATEIAASTITGAKIAANTITGTQISGTTLSAIFADMGTLTAGSIVIGSTNKLWLNDAGDGGLAIGGSVKGSAPFQVSAAGVLTATNASITGTIDANAGYLGDLTIDGVLNIASGGEIRQGTGVLGSNYTGLRVWRDSWVGRIGGYNADTLQWYAGTDGKLYAGGGNVSLDSDGININAGSTLRFVSTSLRGVIEAGNPVDSSISNYPGLTIKSNGSAVAETVNLLAKASSNRRAEVSADASSNSTISLYAYPGSAATASLLQLSTSSFSVAVGSTQSTLAIPVSGTVQLTGNLLLDELSSTPDAPGEGYQARMYLKSDKLIIQYKDGINTRYKYLDLTGTGITWTHTTTAP